LRNTVANLMHPHLYAHSLRTPCSIPQPVTCVRIVPRVHLTVVEGCQYGCVGDRTLVRTSTAVRGMSAARPACCVVRLQDPAWYKVPLCVPWLACVWPASLQGAVPGKTAFDKAKKWLDSPPSLASSPSQPQHLKSGQHSRHQYTAFTIRRLSSS
jgi:hypothetical protein